MGLGELTIETVKPLVGTSFRLTLPDGRTTELKLDEALSYEVRQRRRRTAPKRQPFSLFFMGDPSIVLEQGMYTLSSEAATWEGVFLVPIGRDTEATDYEAVFT